MSHIIRLANYIREQGPGQVFTTHEISQALGINRNDAATYLRRAAERGWVQVEGANRHGGRMRRLRGSVAVQYVSVVPTAEPLPEPIAPMCPRCNINPPRYARARTMGRTPICSECRRDKWKEKYARKVGRGWTKKSTAEPERGHEDISPEAIERRFAAALAQIRRRA